jgi:hypothetical protein
MVATLLDIHSVVWAKLDAIVGVNVYDGEVVDANGEATNPPYDTDGRVHAYAILYMAPGNRYAGSLNGAQTSLDGSFQVTCAGGDQTRALWCVDKVRTALIGTSVTVDGVTRYIRAREEDPGPLRRDDDVQPSRHYLPLEFILHAP